MVQKDAVGGASICGLLQIPDCHPLEPHAALEAETLAKDSMVDNIHQLQGTDWTREVVRAHKTTKTTTYHPPANRMVSRFNQGIKRAILAAYVAELDPEDEVVKYVDSYRNTPHSVTGEKPSFLLFN